jgi:tetratricopeptide (TPR) repeat protein
MSERFDRLRAIIEQALEVPASKRTAWVTRACGADETMREEALALASALEDEDFLVPVAPADGVLLGPGARIGRYRLQRVVGEGGMGTVYEAEQASPRRTVALKVMTGGLLRAGAQRRFRYEAELLGRLRHPGIAAVYEAGVHRAHASAPRPWFAMELVAGAKDLLAHASSRNLDRRGRLRLFLEVLDAVEYGHRMGVIHRDLKPDNLLVDDDGRLKVIDFGVARVLEPDALEASMRTRREEIVGTLAYMSPEQVAGEEVDTRSDVYALGVVLYRLLVDDLPIDVRTTSFLVAARRIAEEPPKRPRGAVALDRDLEAIVLRTLAKEPAGRYGSVSALAEDLERYLRGEPVAARVPGLLHQARLFARRHRVFVTAGLLVLVVVLAAAVVSMDSAVRSQRAERTARTERDRYRTLFETQVAESIETVARRAPEVARLYGGAGMALGMMQSAIERLQALEPHSEGDPAFTLSLAQAYLRLSGALVDRGARAGDFEQAAGEAARRGYRLAMHMATLHPHHPGAKRTWAQAHLQLSSMHMVAGEFERATALVEEGLTLVPAAGGVEIDLLRAQLLYGAGRIAQLRGHEHTALNYLDDQLALAKPLQASRLPEDEVAECLSSGYLSRANVRRTLRDFRGAHADLLACKVLLEALLARHPERLTHRLTHAYTVNWLAVVMMALGRRKEAHDYFRRAHALSEDLLALAPNHVGVLGHHAEAIKGLGSMASDIGVHDHPSGSQERRAKLEEALRHYRASLAVYEGLDAQGQLDVALRRDRDHTQMLLKAFTRMLER